MNWIGYQLGTGAAAQNIKVLQEGDILENTYTISEITFQRQKDTAGNVVAASSNAGKSTHPVELVITATPTSGSGFPITKSFKTTLITDTPATSPSNNVVGCSVSKASGSVIISQYGSNIRCPNDEWVVACGYNPGQEWNYNYCNGRGHAVSYGWKAVWNPGKRGYDLQCTGTGTYASQCGWGPYKAMDLICAIEP